MLHVVFGSHQDLGQRFGSTDIAPPTARGTVYGECISILGHPVFPSLPNFIHLNEKKERKKCRQTNKSEQFFILI